MKKLATLVIGLFLLVGMSNAQNWKFDHLLYDFHLPQSNSWGVHGVAVAPDGNVWLALHGNLAQDTLFTPAGDTINLRPIYILDPATGQHVSGSPIEYLELPDGSVDTLTSSGKGIGLDKDGNILYVAGHTLYRIDYKTHKALNKWVAPEAKSLTEAAQANDGNIYITYVVPGGRPMFILDNNFKTIVAAIKEGRVIYNNIKKGF